MLEVWRGEGGGLGKLCLGADLALVRWMGAGKVRHLVSPPCTLGHMLVSFNLQNDLAGGYYY